MSKQWMSAAILAVLLGLVIALSLAAVPALVRQDRILSAEPKPAHTDAVPGLLSGTIEEIPKDCTIGQHYHATYQPVGENEYVCVGPTSWHPRTWQQVCFDASTPSAPPEGVPKEVFGWTVLFILALGAMAVWRLAHELGQQNNRLAAVEEMQIAERLDAIKKDEMAARSDSQSSAN